LVGDGSSGVFKIINSWGKNVGINGYGFISYNMFFLPVSNGGITRQLIAFE
jgi:C1A family cysteine protease